MSGARRSPFSKWRSPSKHKTYVRIRHSILSGMHHLCSEPNTHSARHRPAMQLRSQKTSLKSFQLISGLRALSLDRHCSLAQPRTSRRQFDLPHLPRRPNHHNRPSLVQFAPISMIRIRILRISAPDRGDHARTADLKLNLLLRSQIRPAVTIHRLNSDER
jgi:hypothetical protein